MNRQPTTIVRFVSRMLGKLKLTIFCCCFAYSQTAIPLDIELDYITYKVELANISPSTSEDIVLNVSVGCSFGVTTYRSFIDAINKKVHVAIDLGLHGFVCTPEITSSVLLGNFPVSGEYTIHMYTNYFPIDGFDEKDADGSFKLTISEPNPAISPEVPEEGTIQSGIGMVRGWACDAKIIEVAFDDGDRIPVAYGTSREDTRSICGDANNGYGMVIAWGLLGEGVHRMKTFIDSIERSDVEFEVSGLGVEFAKGLSGTYELQDFPAPGGSVTLEWSEAHQNFIIVDHTD